MSSSYFQLISGEKRGLGATLSRLGLAPLAVPYGVVTALRNFAYDNRLFSVERVPAPVVSLGNLTTGGTGKTPIAAWLAAQFSQAGLSPGIVSRGYRPDASGKNDEALVLERLIPHALQVRNRDRVAGAQEAIRKGADIILLDDGFQHRRLHRDFNILLIDALNPFGFGHLLPRGLLRESLRGLCRADLILLTRADLVNDTALSEIASQIRKLATNVPVIQIAFQPDRLVSNSGETLPLSELNARKVLAFCGIGNANGFWRTLTPFTDLSEAAQKLEFPDHHHYSASDLEKIVHSANEISADLLITTHKDLVKIPRKELGGIPLFALETGVAISDPNGAWPRYLESILTRGNPDPRKTS